MRNAILCKVLAALVIVVIPSAALAMDRPGPAESQMERILRHGDRGEAVRALQAKLIAAGFDPGEVDGIFGPRTEAAVRAAQSALGLEVDGLAGPRTMAALRARGHEEGNQGKRPDDTAPGVSLVFYRAVPSLALAGLRAGKSAAEPASSSDSAAMQRPETETRPALFGLTFNGTPDPALLPGLLASLRRHGMKATFFVTGEAAAQRPDLLAAIAAEGHEIASNGLSRTDMTRLTPGEQREHLRRAQQAIVGATGRTPAFFRPPGGRFDAGLVQSAASGNLKLVLWSNVAVRDRPEADPDRLAERLAEGLYPGAVLMLHQDRPASVTAADLLLRAARNRGYQSVTLSELLLSEVGATPPDKVRHRPH